MRNNVTDLHLVILAWRSKNKADSWPMYYVNRYKFHTIEWGREKKNKTTVEFVLKVMSKREKLIGKE